MKNINYIINGVLAVAVVILFVTQFPARRKRVYQARLFQQERELLQVNYPSHT